MEYLHIGKGQRSITKLKLFGSMLIDGEILTSFQFSREGGPIGIEESQEPPQTGHLRNAP